MLDENTDVQMSTTPPKKPVYDGNYYYYMPWYDYKPAILVDSKWEDNTHRIKSMNFLMHICHKLVRYFYLILHVCSTYMYVYDSVYVHDCMDVIFNCHNCGSGICDMYYKNCKFCN